MLIKRSTYLACSPERCFEEVQTTRLLQYIAHPLVHFAPVEPPTLPEHWSEGEYVVKLKLFGMIPFGKQWIRISMRDRSQEMGHFHVELRDNGFSKLVAKWDHLIIIQQADGGCCYSDHVHVKAGMLTPLIGAFAWFFYRHRQRRWHHLVAANFTYPDV